ncbi:MAG: hypothetical protein AAFY34_15850 [Pseudomonadota bacterium]
MPALCLPAEAVRLSDELEFQRITGVGFTPQTVTLDNTYVSPVPICTHILPSPAVTTAVPRIGIITSNSFQLSMQSMPDTNPGVPFEVHCVIAEEGTHNLPDGRQFQAATITVTDVLGQNAGGFGASDVSVSVSSGFSNPVAMGAVITSNDSRVTAFHADDCETRQNEPFRSGPNDGICVGYHIGQQSDSPPYAAETVGVLIVEAGTGTVNNVFYEVDRGPTSIDGVGNGGGNTYTVGGDFDVGIASLAGTNGGQGGWAVLVGPDPLPSNQLRLAVEEEIAAGDRTRSHVNETVDYWVFRDDNAPQLALTKTADTSIFDFVGQVVNYAFLVENTGNTSIDNLAVTDDLIASVTCPVTSLAAGANTTCTASYTITATDVSSGSVTNNASATGDPSEGVLTPATDTETVTFSGGTAAISADKTVTVFDPAAEGLYATPQNDFLYTITVVNSGTGFVDLDTIFLVDDLPAEVEFFNGDADGPGPETGRVIFDETDTGLTFSDATDLGFSDSITQPVSMAECTYTPTAGYDPNVRFVCLAPKGALSPGSPDPEFSLTFRVRLR